jgi:hypothetical protein
MLTPAAPRFRVDIRSQGLRFVTFTFPTHTLKRDHSLGSGFSVGGVRLTPPGFRITNFTARTYFLSGELDRAEAALDEVLRSIEGTDPDADDHVSGAPRLSRFVYDN